MFVCFNKLFQYSMTNYYLLVEVLVNLYLIFNSKQLKTVKT